jgi:GAF domain-containing protein
VGHGTDGGLRTPVKKVVRDKAEGQPEPVKKEAKKKASGTRKEPAPPGPVVDGLKELDALRAILKDLGTKYDFDEVAQKVVNGLHKVLPFDRAYLGLLDRTGEKMMLYVIYLEETAAWPGALSSELDAGRPIPKSDGGMWAPTKDEMAHICNMMESKEKETVEGRILIKEGMRSYITVPLTVDGKIEGIVGFYSHNPCWFREEHLRTLEPGVSLIAWALKGSRMEGQLRDTIRKMQLVDRASEMARAIQDDDEFLDKLLKEAQHAFGQFNFIFFVVDPEARLFRIRHFQVGFQYQALKGYTQDLDKGMLAKVYRSKAPMVVGDATKEEGFVEAPDTVIRAEIEAPAIVHDKVVGILSAVTPYPFDFKAYEIWVMKQLAEVIGLRLYSDEFKS